MEDNIETVFIEYVWQILDAKLTDRLFGLPISIYIRHPLRFTVAHRKHGMQLRSAWTNLHPSSIEERDSSKDRMSIEASVVNYCKSNFPEDQYPAMKKDLVDNLIILKVWNGPCKECEKYEETQWLKDPRAHPGPSVRGKNQSSAILDGWDDDYTRDEAEREDEIEDEEGEGRTLL